MHRFTKLRTAGIALIAASCIAFGGVSATHGQEQEEAQIKMFSLQNADAAELMNTVRALMDDDRLRMTVDSRTNTLLARGPAEMLSVIEAILLRLDEELAGASSSSTSEEPSSPEQTRLSDSPDAASVVADSPLNGVVRSLAPTGSSVEKGDVIITNENAVALEAMEALKIETETKPSEALRFEQQAKALKNSDLQLERRLVALRVEHGKAELAYERDALEAELKLTADSLAVLRKTKETLTRQQARRSDRDPRSLLEVRLRIQRAEKEKAMIERRLEMFQKYVCPLRMAELEGQLLRIENKLDKATAENEERTQ